MLAILFYCLNLRQAVQKFFISFFTVLYFVIFSFNHFFIFFLFLVIGSFYFYFWSIVCVMMRHNTTCLRMHNDGVQKNWETRIFLDVCKCIFICDREKCIEKNKDGLVQYPEAPGWDLQGTISRLIYPSGQLQFLMCARERKREVK